MTRHGTSLIEGLTDRAARRDRLHDIRPGDRWLVAVAHPDDESFGCGSVIAHAVARGARVTVLCATRGEAGEVASAALAADDLGVVREAELRQAAEVLGVAEVRLLGYRDSGFDGPSPAGSLCAARLDDVTDQLLDVIAALAPQVVLVLDGSDGHRDHVRIRTAACAAIAELTLEAPASAPHLYEHCLPNALMRRWLAEMQVTRPDTAYHSLDPATLGRPDDEITDVVDVRAVLRIREEAISRHRSQSSPFDGLSAPLREAFLTTDHLARMACAR